MPGCGSSLKQRRQAPLKTREPRKALIIYYSQTGHTAGIAGHIDEVWKSSGLEVDLFNIRHVDPSDLGEYDLIAVGSPVYYLDVPKNVRQWLKSLQSIRGIPVASFVTYGGNGHNHHNTACELLELLSDKGGIPVGIAKFAHMNTFPPLWVVESKDRILKYRDLPNEETYNSARQYAADLMTWLKQGTSVEVEREFCLEGPAKYMALDWFTKIMITEHSIDKLSCHTCGICEATCPVGAIQISSQTIDTGRCIVCMGCINNCPNNA